MLRGNCPHGKSILKYFLKKSTPLLLLVLIVAICTLSILVLLVGEGDQESLERNFSKEVTLPSEALDKEIAQVSNQAADFESLALSLFQAGPLPVDSYLQVVLTDEGTIQSRALRILSVDKNSSYFQYEFESTDGEAGIITVSPQRVFAFIQTRDGVYEYEGDSLELNLRRSRMEGLEDDVYRSELKAIRK